MARCPTIDSPCPLGAEARSRLQGHCSHCNKTVHSLDGMEDAQRAAFMAKATGPICVSYRRPIVIGAAALAISMASPAFAQGVHKAADADRHCPNADHRFQPQATATGPVTPTHAGQATGSTPAEANAQPPEHVFVMLGGVSDPRHARWTDDDASAPDLPMVRDDKPPSR